MIRYYRIKVYLNASHYVVFDGKKGEVHPHTWSFTATVYTSSNDVVKFTNHEKAVEDVIEPYQNKVLNDMPPFGALMPSLENLTEYFATQTQEAVRPYGYRLKDFEGSETPVRTYGIVFPEADELDEDDIDEVEAALGRLEGNVGK
ncbi:MAG: 6-carboxytetrahydropterin synthase [Saccharofermentans sp.]|nr:6-carboxytetrahydropterin synthase [Saccharofermentans sp.]